MSWGSYLYLKCLVRLGVLRQAVRRDWNVLLSCWRTLPPKTARLVVGLLFLLDKSSTIELHSQPFAFQDRSCYSSGAGLLPGPGMTGTHCHTQPKVSFERYCSHAPGWDAYSCAGLPNPPLEKFSFFCSQWRTGRLDAHCWSMGLLSKSPERGQFVNRPGVSLRERDQYSFMKSFLCYLSISVSAEREDQRKREYHECQRQRILVVLYFSFLSFLFHLLLLCVYVDGVSAFLCSCMHTGEHRPQPMCVWESVLSILGSGRLNSGGRSCASSFTTERPCWSFCISQLVAIACFWRQMFD